MASPKIVLYQPNAPLRSGRIDAKEWDRLRPRVEELYVKDERKLEEVMEIMALQHSFYASRRQYTQKLKQWGLFKNVSAKVMKSALRKRARAGENGVSVKFRGTAITEENMDRWQQRVPTFDPMSTPTADTPSQMDVESPHVALSQQRADTLQSLVARSPPIGSSDHNQADGASDDDVISIAYDDIRRSVSPQVAEYIFKPRKGQISSGSSSLAKASWSINSLFSLPLAEPELMRLTEKKVSHLQDLAINLWNFGNGKYLECIAHIEEVLLARESSSQSENVWALDEMRARLSMTYLNLGRITECETLLTDGLCEIESLRPKSPEGNLFRVLLAHLRSSQGQHSLAEELCVKVILSQRSTLGLNNYYTWKAYDVLGEILRSQNKFDKERRLTTGFYLDVYQTLSEAFLPGLRAALAVCRNYIEVWMTESKLQRLVGDLFICDRPLGISERNKLTLSVIFIEGLREESRLGVVPQILEDFGEMVGLHVEAIISTFALLIALRIQAVRYLESASLQQEALRVVKEFKFTKFSVPLWVFVHLNETDFWTGVFDWKVAEQDFIHSLEDAVTKGGHPMVAPTFSISTGIGSPRSGLTVDNPTPPFTFGMPPTPHATCMSPPPRPGQNSPVTAPSSVLIGRPDFPTPPNLFGLPHSPLPPSPSLGSGPSPGS